MESCLGESAATLHTDSESAGPKCQMLGLLGTWPNGAGLLPGVPVRALPHGNRKVSATLGQKFEMQSSAERHEQSSSRLTMRKKYNKLRKNDGNIGRAREYNHEILWLFRDWKMGFQRPASLHSTCAGSFHLGLCATDLPFRHGSFPANYHPAEV